MSRGRWLWRTSSGRASSKTLSSACSSPVASGRGAPLRPPGSVLRRVSPSSSSTLSSGASGRGTELGRSASALQGTALRALDVRGCSGFVNSDGMRRPSGSACSEGSSAVVMHGHRMRNDIDLDSVFVLTLARSCCLLLLLVKLVTVVRVLFRVESTVVHQGKRIHVIHMQLEFKGTEGVEYECSAWVLQKRSLLLHLEDCMMRRGQAFR